LISEESLETQIDFAQAIFSARRKKIDFSRKILVFLRDVHIFLPQD
jgi:hypothetical protein